MTFIGVVLRRARTTGSCCAVRSAPIITSLAPLAVAALGSPASAPAQSAEPWTIKEFEVLAVEPMRNWGPFSYYGPDKNRMANDLTDLLVALARVSPVDFEAVGARTIELDPTIKARMEDHLSKTADLLESWGFPPPRLDPVVKIDGGRTAYRIFVLASLPDDEAAGEYHGPLCSVAVFGLERKTETIIQIDGRRLGNYRVGALGTSALTTLSHELFHAVQYATPFYEGTACEGRVGGWITEGTADAIGWDAVRIIGGVNVANNPDSWGARTYSRPLPVPAAHGGRANIKNRRYMTASFWRYLAEFEAIGQPPGAAPGTVDYRSLSSFLSGKPTGRDCVGADDPCDAELAYLDQWLSGRYGGAQLRDMYARFVGAYSLYGAYRLDAMYGNTADRITSWQGWGFNRSCGLIELKNQPEELHKQEVVAIDDVAAECWNIEPQGFQDPVLVEVVASGPSPTLLQQLTAAVATSGDASVTGPGGDGLGSGNVKTEKARVLGDPQRGFRTRWVFEIDNGKETPFLLANVADEAEKTHAMQRVSVSFTALEPYAVITRSPDPSITSAPGPSGDEVDRPLGVRFDRNLKGVVSDMTETLHRRDPGLTQPCLLAVPGLSNAQGDALTFFMDHEGPIGPGDYPVADATRDPFGYRGGSRGSAAPPGAAVVNFTLGFLNQPPAQQLQNFVGIAGTLKVELVAGRFVTGVLDVVGENSRAEDIALDREEPPANYLPGAAIRVEFGLLMQDPSDPARHRGATDCLTSKPGPHRTASGNGGTPTGSPDPPSDDPGPPAEEAPPSGSEAGSGLPADGSREPTAEPAGGPENEAADAARPSEAATGHLGPGKTRWVRVWAKDRPDLSFSGSDLDGSAGATFTCWTGNPVNISLYEGDTARNATLGVTLITTPDIPEGATGTYRIDQVLYVFQGGALEWRGPVTLELTRHHASADPGARRVAGRILGLRVVDRTTDALIPIEAEFDVNAACAPFGR